LEELCGLTLEEEKRNWSIKIKKLVKIPGGRIIRAERRKASETEV